MGTVAPIIISYGTNLSIVPSRLKSGNFGHQVNSDSDLFCFIFLLFE